MIRPLVRFGYHRNMKDKMMEEVVDPDQKVYSQEQLVAKLGEVVTGSDNKIRTFRKIGANKFGWKDKYGRLHNIDGSPALIEPGKKGGEYFKHGLIHNTKGPAKINPFKRFYLNGVYLSESKWGVCVKRGEYPQKEIFNGMIGTVWRNKDGLLSNLVGPATPSGDCYLNSIKITELERLRASQEEIEPKRVNGIVQWFDTEGRLHNPAGPAIIRDLGPNYYLRGHPVGKATIEGIISGELTYRPIDKDGFQICDSNGKLHNPDGPAKVSNGQVEFYQHGFLHNIEGPAIFSGSKVSYFLEGERMSFEEWQKKLQDEEEIVEPAEDKVEAKPHIAGYTAGDIRTCKDGTKIIFVVDDEYTGRWCLYEEYISSRRKIVHNDAGPAEINISPSGIINSTKYVLNGKLHSKSGPALNYRGTEFYYLNGIQISKALWLASKDYDTLPYLEPGGLVWRNSQGKLHHPILSATKEGKFLNGVKVTAQELSSARAHNLTVEYNDGIRAKMWKKNGVLHNPHGPAVIYGKGILKEEDRFQYYLEGLRLTEKQFEDYVEQDLRTTGSPSGNILRMFKGELLHNAKGPAVIGLNGYEAWYQNGFRHREDGPAVVQDRGNSYFLRGIQYSKEQWENQVSLIKSMKEKSEAALGELKESEALKTVREKITEYSEKMIEKSEKIGSKIEDKVADATATIPFGTITIPSAIKYDREMVNPFLKWAPIPPNYKSPKDKIPVTVIKADKKVKIPVEVVKEQPSPQPRIEKPKEESDEIGVGGVLGMVMAGTLVAGVLSKQKAKRKAEQQQAQSQLQVEHKEEVVAR